MINSPIVQPPHLWVRKRGPRKWYGSHARSHDQLRTHQKPASSVPGSGLSPASQGLRRCVCFLSLLLHAQEGLPFSLNLEMSLRSLRTFKKMSPKYFANTHPRKPLPLSRLHPKNSRLVLWFQPSVGPPPLTDLLPHPGAAQCFSPSSISRVSKHEGRGTSSRWLPWCPQRVTSELRALGSLLVPLMGTLETAPCVSCPLRIQGKTGMMNLRGGTGQKHALN